MSEILSQRGEHQRAISELEGAIQFDQRNFLLYYYLGYLYFQLSDVQKVHEQYHYTIPKDLKNASTQVRVIKAPTMQVMKRKITKHIEQVLDSLEPMKKRYE